jgi:hypothetical protein
LPPSITEDDYLVWREHPVTRWVFAAIEQGAQAQKDEWIRASWDGAAVSPILLTELRTRADAYRALPETSFERWSELNATADA